MLFLKNSILIAITFLSCSVAFADDQGFETIPGQVQFSVYGSTNDNKDALFTTDVILPLYYPSDHNTLVFFNPKFTYTDPAAREYNIGAGIRHIFDDSYILGLGLFIDNREVRNGLYFMQAGVSLEYLSHPLDLRANWYKPTTGAKILDTTYSFGSTSLIAHNNTMEALQGLDIEAGVPLLDKYTSTRGYVGGYFYQSQTAKDVNGFRARTETNLTNWLSIDTVFNSNIDKKEEFYGGLRVAVAFDLAQIGKGKVFSSASLAGRKATTLGDRLFDRVVRDIDIQSTTGIYDAKAHDLFYVNNTNAGSQDGSQAHPYTSIQTAVNAASGGGWVYVEGQGAANYAPDVALTNNVALWGSGSNGGLTGITVSGVHPIINGGGDGVTLANNNQVIGMKIQNTGNGGIKFTDGVTTTVSIRDNILTGNAVGINFYQNTGRISGVTISGNTITNSTGNGINFVQNEGTISNLRIIGNTINSNGENGITFTYNGGSSKVGTITDVMIANNTINSNTQSGFVVDANGFSGGSGTLDRVSFINNTIRTNGGGAIVLTNNGYGGYGLMSNIVITGNTLTNSTDNAVSFANNGFLSGTGVIRNVFIDNNNMNSAGANGIDVSFNGNQGNGVIENMTIINNSINSPGDTSLNFANNGDNGNGTLRGLTFTNNVMSGGGVGLSFISNGKTGIGRINDVAISRNTITDKTFSALDLSLNGSTGGDGVISSFAVSHNSMTNNSEYGIFLSNAAGGSMSSLNFSGQNSLFGNGLGDLSNGSGINNLSAQNNWWGQASGPIAGQVIGANTVNTSSPLASQP
jgi:hypothetical protein